MVDQIIITNDSAKADCMCCHTTEALGSIAMLSIALGLGAGLGLMGAFGGLLKYRDFILLFCFGVLLLLVFCSIGAFCIYAAVQYDKVPPSLLKQKWIIRLIWASVSGCCLIFLIILGLVGFLVTSMILNCGEGCGILGLMLGGGFVAFIPVILIILMLRTIAMRLKRERNHQKDYEELSQLSLELV
jgi:uncharacterized membrane protein